MGIITLTPQRNTAVDFSYPYFFNRLGFISKKPLPLTKLMAIMWPYHKIVWATMAVTLPFFSLIFWSFSMIQQEGMTTNIDFGAVLQEVSQMLVMQGVNITQSISSTSHLYIHLRYQTMALDMEKQDVIALLGIICLCCCFWCS